MKILTSYSLKLVKILDQAAGWAIALTMFLVVMNIVLRIFDMPIGGTYEWVGFLTALAIGLSLAYCESKGGHVAVTFFMDKLPPKFQQVTDILTNILVLMFLIMSSWEIISYANSMAVNGEIAQTTKVPIYPFIYIIAFGFIAFSLITVIKILETIRKVAEN